MWVVVVGVAILSVASRYGNRDKLLPCGPPWPECDCSLPYKEVKLIFFYSLLASRKLMKVFWTSSILNFRYR